MMVFALKKSILCILLVLALLLSAASCADSPEAENPPDTESSSVPREGFVYPTLSQSERALAFRYFYIGKWNQLCYNTDTLKLSYGSGSKFKSDVSPEEQQYISADGSEKSLWSDKLAETAAAEINRTMALFDAAAADDTFEMTEGDTKQIEQALAFAQKSAQQKSLTVDEYLAESYGSGFTYDIFKKVLTIEIVSYTYTSKLTRGFMEKMSKEIVSYEEYSEVASDDCEKYTDELVKSYTHNFYPTDAACSQGKRDALNTISESLLK